jgi:PST family polysaccharide transporter
MGRWFGAGALGLYSRPNQLLALAMQHIGWPLTQVMLATLVRREGSSPDFARHVRGTANLIAHLTLPLAAWCAAVPEETVHVLLGRDWLAAAPLLRWLAIAAATSYLGATIYGLNVATRRTRRLAAMTAILLVATTAALWIARSHGPEGLAAAIALTNLALLVPRLWWATRDTPVRLRDYACAFAGPLVVAGIFAAGLIGGRMLASEAGLPVRLAVAALCGMAAAGVCALAWPRTREEFKQLWQHLPFAR